MPNAKTDLAACTFLRTTITFQDRIANEIVLVASLCSYNFITCNHRISYGYEDTVDHIPASK
jgi:hypothetical protein